MKEEILKRAMFAMPLSKEAQGTGIMSGFDMDEMEDDVDTNADMEDMPPMARTPQNPEILMNNLRGDMRSVDARYMELAQMVGEEAAMETPPEVLAMLMGQMGAQQAGIGALPEAQNMMPPGAGMPPPAQQGGAPMMPEPMAAPAPAQQGEGIGALPQAQAMMPPGVSPPAPQQLARGGVVQHFKSGTGPNGVEPADDEGDDSASASYLPPEFARALLPVAQSRMTQLATQQPTRVPGLQESMNARIPIYQQLLGGKDDNYRQSQILMDIAQRGLGFAANVDDQGRPLTGSFASRLAGAARTLPGTINAINAEKAKEGMAIKQMALGQAEKDVSAARGQNEKLVESQRKLFGDILKAAGKGGGAELFGKGAWEWKTVNTPGLMDRFSKGETTPEEDGLIQSAYSKLTKPQIESYTDPFSGNRVEKTIPGFQIPFVEEAMRQRAKLGAGGTGAAPVPVAPARQPSTGQGSTAPTPATMLAPGALPPQAAGAPTRDTVFGAAQASVGPGPAFKSFVAGLPVVGGESEETRLRTFTTTTMRELVSAMQNNPKFPEGEREAIAAEIGDPLKVISNPGDFRSSVMGLDESLLRRQLSSEKIVANQNIPVERRKIEEDKALEIKRIRETLGVPVRIYTRKDIEALTPGTPFLWQGKTLAIRNKDQK
jgi:hypothetical protein